jgi:hypothetical protein
MKLPNWGWYGWLNFLVLQWFFVRLIKCQSSARGTWYEVTGFMLPLTGWWGSYVWIGPKPKRLK